MRKLTTFAAMVLGSAATAALAAPTQFTGADAGEGLDLTGTFVYAINASGPAATGNLQVLDATFIPQGPTASAVNGVKIGATNDQPNWTGAPSGPSWSNSTADTNLAEILRHISWTSGNDVTLDMDVVPGQAYKLQLLFYEGCCDGRGYGVLAEGTTIESSFQPGPAQGGAGNSVGSVITYNYVATDNKLNVILDSVGTFGDNNPIINGFTLEAVPEPTSVGLFGMAALSLIRWKRRM